MSERLSIKSFETTESWTDHDTLNLMAEHTFMLKELPEVIRLHETEPQRGHAVERSVGRTVLEQTLEKEPHASTDMQRIVGRSALEAATEEEDPFDEMLQGTEESIRRADGLAYAQDQEEYRSYVGIATSIIMEAFTDDLGALDQIPNTAIREALKARILAGNAEIDKMISVACIGLAG